MESTDHNYSQIRIFQMDHKHSSHPSQDKVASELKLPSLNFFRQTFCESVCMGMSQSSMPYLYSTVIENYNRDDTQSRASGAEGEGRDSPCNRSGIEIMLNKIDNQLRIMKQKNDYYNKLSPVLLNLRTSLNERVMDMKRSGASRVGKGEKENMFSFQISKTFQRTHYNDDFSSYQILGKLSKESQRKIRRIKDYFRNLRRGGAIPDGFDLRKSVSEDNPPERKRDGEGEGKVCQEFTIQVTAVSSKKPSNSQTRNESACLSDQESLSSRDSRQQQHCFEE